MALSATQAEAKAILGKASLEVFALVDLSPPRGSRLQRTAGIFAFEKSGSQLHVQRLLMFAFIGRAQAQHGIGELRMQDRLAQDVHQVLPEFPLESQLLPADADF